MQGQNFTVYDGAQVALGVNIPENARIHRNARIDSDTEVMVRGPMGSENRYVTVHRTEDNGHIILAGCWFGTVDELRSRISDADTTWEDYNHDRRVEWQTQYRAFCDEAERTMRRYGWGNLPPYGHETDPELEALLREEEAIEASVETQRLAMVGMLSERYPAIRSWMDGRGPYSTHLMMDLANAVRQFVDPGQEHSSSEHVGLYPGPLDEDGNPTTLAMGRHVPAGMEWRERDNHAWLALVRSDDNAYPRNRAFVQCRWPKPDPVTITLERSDAERIYSDIARVGGLNDTVLERALEVVLDK